MVASLLIAVIVLVATSLQRVTGIGFGLVAGPGLVLLLGAGPGVLVSNAAAGAISAVGLMATWRRVRLSAMLPLVCAAMLTVPMGAWLVGRLQESVLLIGVGAIVAAAVALIAAGVRVRSLRGRRGAVVAGAASGAMNSAAGVGGPPLTLYAVNAGWSGSEFVANAQFYGVVVNGLSVAAKGVPELSRTSWLFVASAVALGILAGDLVARGKTSDAGLRRIVLSLAMLGGVSILFKGIVAAV